MSISPPQNCSPPLYGTLAVKVYGSNGLLWKWSAPCPTSSGSRHPACEWLSHYLPLRALFLFGEHLLHGRGFRHHGQQFASKGENLLTVLVVIFVNQIAKPYCHFLDFGGHDLHRALDVLLDPLWSEGKVFKLLDRQVHIATMLDRIYKIMSTCGGERRRPCNS